VHREAVSAWIAFAEGRTAEALAQAATAADLEDAVEKHPVTPGEVLPARELFADMLYEAKRYDESLTQYDAVLVRAPNRLNALLGAADAAARTGQAALAEQYLAVARDQTRAGNRQRVHLDRSVAGN